MIFFFLNFYFFEGKRNEESISILSPKLFSFARSDSNRSKVLSPTLFSFRREGLFSIPELFNVFQLLIFHRISSLRIHIFLIAKPIKIMS